MKLTNAFISLCCTILTLSCAGNGSDSRPHTQIKTATDDNLLIPEVPVTVVGSQAIAAYTIMHYWDNMDFSDTTRVNDDRFMEQNFAGYLSAFPYAGYDDAANAAEALMKKAEVSPQAYHRVMEIAERFLTSPNSSMRDEETYYLFLQAIDRSEFLDDTRRIRVRAQIADVLKNRCGTPAADFAFTDNRGRRTSLYREASENQVRLIVFYDPECSHCHEIMTSLKQSEILAAALQAGVIKVIAVYPDGDKDIWQKARDSMPDTWINGMSPDGEVSENEIYTLPAMPVMYLIAPDNTVLLKDTTQPAVEEWLLANFQ